MTHEREEINAWWSGLVEHLEQMPDGHWLFMADGSLSLVRYDNSGQRAVHPLHTTGQPGGGEMDQDYVVHSYSNLRMDGGAW